MTAPLPHLEPAALTHPDAIKELIGMVRYEAGTWRDEPERERDPIEEAGFLEAIAKTLEALAARSAPEAGKAVDGPWCQPMKNGEHQPRQFIIYYEDPSVGIAAFDNEADARDQWERSKDNWNCYLFGSLPLASVPAPSGADREIGWLIERKYSNVLIGATEPRWYAERANGDHWWTPVPNDAKRFASKAEAEVYPAYQMIASDPDISITEHVWINDGFSWSHGRAGPVVRQPFGSAPSGATATECATADCGNPATRYYSKLGVGSHHCEECYQRITDLASTPQAVPAEDIAGRLNGERSLLAIDQLRRFATDPETFPFDAGSADEVIEAIDEAAAALTASEAEATSLRRNLEEANRERDEAEGINLLDGDGWVFWNPDSGEEYSPDHPIESGQCEDAQNIRNSTAQEDLLWQSMQRDFARSEAAERKLEEHRKNHRASQFLAWACETFTSPVATNIAERLMRFAEEAVELAMACEMPRTTLDKIVERVYGREPGNIKQETAQCQVTLELLAEVLKIDLDTSADEEFQRVQSIPKEHWDRRHAAKVALGIATQVPGASE